MINETITITITKYGEIVYNNLSRLIEPSEISPYRIIWLNEKHMYHRIASPAYISEFKYWYINGERYKNRNDYYDALSEEDRVFCFLSSDFITWDK